MSSISARIAVWPISERQLDFLRQLCRQTRVAEATLLHEVNRVRRPEWLPAAALEALRREQAAWAIKLMIDVRDGKCPPLAPPGQTRFL